MLSVLCFKLKIYKISLFLFNPGLASNIHIAYHKINTLLRFHENISHFMKKHSQNLKNSIYWKLD